LGCLSHGPMASLLMSSDNAEKSRFNSVNRRLY
jgi:hypothetical protein